MCKKKQAANNNSVTQETHNKGVNIMANKNTENKAALNKFKEEIASELNVDLKNGADNTARENGSVGGEMVKRMIEKQEASMK